MNHIVAVNHKRYNGIIAELNHNAQGNFIPIYHKKDLTYQYLSKIDPGYVFFPHWSYIIPEEIYLNFKCVIFHMTDLPFGRGGSPLQNLIARGIYETQISAIRCEAELDAGPVYMKKPLSLYGSAEEIYLRAAAIITGMIKDMVDNQPEPIAQDGKGYYFSRRRPEESNIADLDSLEKMFDYIRMLDADNYPRAFIETDHFRLEFERASLRSDCIKADVVITKKQK